MGNRESNIRKALKALERSESFKVVKSSSLYETKPFGYLEQENFYNSVVKGETNLNAEELLDLVSHIETKIGRKSRFKWGPREIDIDILFFNSDVILSDKIKIPHPGIPERDFVLVPLDEIEPDFIHPELNKKISDICKSVTENNIIRKITDES
jgi:2-amino-4-hydroxy-6-hydroxymethyldihydropteridine diphosphokinase